VGARAHHMAPCPAGALHFPPLTPCTPITPHPGTPTNYLIDKVIRYFKQKFCVNCLYSKHYMSSFISCDQMIVRFTC
jgi:hypothetical protein